MESRSRKSAKNIIFGFLNKGLLMLLAFATRTVFIRLLGAEYNGVNGLYSNILTMLSLAELGIGNVLTFSLYRALLQKDKEEICSLVFTYKKIYRIIAAFVLGIGVALVPFLRLIVKSDMPYEKVVLYYLLYLANSVSTYFVIYKTTVIIADQKYYIMNVTNLIVNIIMYVGQIVFLLIFGSFTGYLVIQVLCTIGNNLVLNGITNYQYPYLKKLGPGTRQITLDSNFVENIRSTAIYKISKVIINNSDNILISIILGTVYVGYYSNYFMLISYVASFIAIATNGMIASLGNLNAQEDKEKSYDVFKTLCFLYNIMTVFSIACFSVVIQNFIPLWIGEEYLLDNVTVAAMLVVFYVQTINNPIWMFRETMGLFSNVRYIMAVAAGLNIVLSILMGCSMGLKGIILATAIAKLSTYFWYEPKILYTLKFHHPVREYFVTQGKYLAVNLFIIVFLILVCSFIPGKPVLFIVKICICGMTVGLVYFLFYHKTSEWEGLKERFRVLRK